jgi:choloylglycine hydrolase
VDISYLGIASGTDLSGDPLARRKLLDAPLLPFDGMNERGLAVGMAADESGSATADPAKPTVGSVRILRLILDRAATVEEALTVMAGINLDFSGGPPLHYLFADRSGASAVVEFQGGQLKIERGGPPWQALTNFRIVGAPESVRQADHRYAVASQALQRPEAAGPGWTGGRHWVCCKPWHSSTPAGRSPMTCVRAACISSPPSGGGPCTSSFCR